MLSGIYYRVRSELLVAHLLKSQRNFIMDHQWNSEAKLPYLQTLANDDHRTGKMKWWDELCWGLWACWPDAKPPATRLQREKKKQDSTLCNSNKQEGKDSPVWSRWVKLNKRQQQIHQGSDPFWKSFLFFFFSFFFSLSPTCISFPELMRCTC